jgi:hypothetical protein
MENEKTIKVKEIYPQCSNHQLNCDNCNKIKWPFYKIEHINNKITYEFLCQNCYLIWEDKATEKIEIETFY